jgi:hypothetical protein
MLGLDPGIHDEVHRGKPFVRLNVLNGLIVSPVNPGNDAARVERRPQETSSHSGGVPFCESTSPAR